MKPKRKTKAAPAKNAVPRTTVKKPAALDNHWMVFGICVLLALMVWIVFGQTKQFPFVNFDDESYVYGNHAVSHGLTANSVASAFGEGGSDNWVPLTTLSHMLDCQLYGLNAGGHHVTNVLLHMATAILLFLVLRKMTGTLWRSAFVAAVFAIHPLRAESVAWISERKDVLCGLFFMLTLWTYTNYVRTKSPVHYAAALLCVALGLLSKPILVTLPFLLLLLDYWPLNRMAITTLRQIIVEKIPFAVLSLAVCVPTILAEKSGIETIEKFPIFLRLENAVVSAAVYLWQFVYPAGLAVLYPFPLQGLPWIEVVAALLLLAAITAGVFYWRIKRPYLFVGWFWFGGMLVPVIGLVQVGGQAMADRHTYLSQIGLCIAVTWLIAELSTSWRHRPLILGSLSAIILTALICCARLQTSYWANSEILWRHALACTPDNVWSRSNYGDALSSDGRTDDAIQQYQQAIKLDPSYSQAHYNLGNALIKNGAVDEAIVQYQEALKLDRGAATAQDHNNLGMALLQKGQLDEAINHFQLAITNDPEYAETYFNLGTALLQKGQVDEAINQLQNAIEKNPDSTQTRNNFGMALFFKGRIPDAVLQYQEALKLDPDYVVARNNLGNALLREGQVDEAIAQYQAALKIQRDSQQFQNNLAFAIWTLAMSPGTNGTKAVELAQNANQATDGSNPLILRALAAADAQKGNFSEAITAARQALALASTQQESALILALQKEITLYQAGSPLPSADQTNLAGWQ
ncbi:MAG TPA: tetratricopeptide repeat protein [Candidatus Acidoferrales bacterium]|nr:tetratricopeptide repeat protein [Candidatus Acidoferrales bacterium]